MPKVKLFTHTDLDGVGCAIIAKKVFGFDNVDVTYCDYKEVNEKITDYMNSGLYSEYSFTYITDISVDEPTAQLIQAFNSRNAVGNWRIALIDHHPTAEWLARTYTWATVKPEEAISNSILSELDNLARTSTLTQKTSGTTLFVDHLEWSGLFIDGMPLNEIFQFAEAVRKYDTWEWQTRYNDIFPKRLNNLLYLIGRGRFLDRFTQNLSLELTDSEYMMLGIEEEKIAKYLEKVGKSILVTNIQGLQAGIVYAESYSSELGNYLATNNENLDFIAIINTLQKSVSYRGIKDNVDLGVIAKIYGGGGHPKAAGSQIPEDFLDGLAVLYFNEYEVAVDPTPIATSWTLHA